MSGGSSRRLLGRGCGVSCGDDCGDGVGSGSCFGNGAGAGTGVGFCKVADDFTGIWVGAGADLEDDEDASAKAFCFSATHSAHFCSCHLTFVSLI